MADPNLQAWRVLLAPGHRRLPPPAIYAKPLKTLNFSESVNRHKCLILLDSCRIHATRSVERLFAWLSRYRRLNIVYDRAPDLFAARVWIAMISIISRRLVAQTQPQ
jgi:hypothetical protein